MGTILGILTIWAFASLAGLAYSLISAKSDGPLVVRPMFAYYDCWIGMYWDHKKRKFYWFPVPMLGLCIYGEDVSIKEN